MGNMYDAYKKVRNQIRKHDPKAVIFRCIKQLNHPDAESVEFIRTYQPWILLLLIKWALLECGTTPYNPNKFDDKDFFKLINLIKEYEDLQSFPESEMGIFFVFPQISVSAILAPEWIVKRRYSSAILFVLRG